MSHQSPTPETPHNQPAQWHGQQFASPQYMGGIPPMQQPAKPFKMQQNVARGITGVAMLGILLGFVLVTSSYTEESLMGLLLIATSTILVVLCSIWHIIASIGNHLCGK